MSPAPSRRHRRQAPTPMRVNLGPLTTIFEPAAHCSRAALAGPSATNARRGQSCKVGGATATPQDDLGCMPRATAYPATLQRGIGFYSPGYMCPAGYASACTAISATKGQTTVAPKVTGTFQFPLVAGETAVGCCPNGYQCAMDGGVQTCQRVATSTQFDAMTCRGQEEDLNAFKVPFTAGSQTISTMTLWAPMVQINHFLSDLPDDQRVLLEQAATQTQSSSSSQITMESVLPSTPASTTAMPTPMPTETDGRGISEHLGSAKDKVEEVVEERSKLSTGAKVGIAFAPLMVAAFIVAFLFYRKWKAHYLYPEEHFMPPRKMVSPSLAPTSPDPNERSPYNEDAANAGHTPKTTPYSPPMPQGPHNRSPNMNTSPFSPPMGQVPYNISHNQDFAAGGPGPAVISPYEYNHNRSETLPNIDEESAQHYQPASPPQTHTVTFTRTIGADGQMSESPIDGTSPFRLKRGNTLKRLTEDRETTAYPQIVGVGANASAQPSPLGQHARATSNTSDKSDSSHGSHFSQDNIAWDYPLKRERSFSRPRPDKVASVYVDRAGRTSSAGGSRSRSASRSSSLYSWDHSSAPGLPEVPAVAVTPPNRSRSFSRPLARPKREASEDTLVEQQHGNVVAPRVTSQGVAF